jgi:hypothetical protein
LSIAQRIANDEAHFQKLLNGRALTDLTKSEAEALCDAYARTDASTGATYRRNSRAYRYAYSGAWNRCLMAQTPEKRNEWCGIKPRACYDLLATKAA